MIKSFIQFAENNINDCSTEVGLVIKEEIEECKSYESRYIKLLKNTKQSHLLYNSIEYNKIKEYNFKYCCRLSKKLAKTEFRFLSNFLTPIFVQSRNVYKYYYMLVDFLGSLYELSLIINKNVGKIQNKIDLDNTVFKIHYCWCSNQTKQNFIFHWVICWITYFSAYCSTPLTTNDIVDISKINVYPKEFFVQFILLIHVNIIHDDDKAWEKQLNKKNVVLLKQTIMESLYTNSNESIFNFLQLSFYNLFSKCNGIHSLDFFYHDTVEEIRMHKSHEEHLLLSNKLIPSCEKLVSDLFGLTRKFYKLTKMKSNKLE